MWCLDKVGRENVRKMQGIASSKESSSSDCAQKVLNLPGLV
jgi:hypothetical protein